MRKRYRRGERRERGRETARERDNGNIMSSGK